MQTKKQQKEIVTKTNKIIYQEKRAKINLKNKYEKSLINKKVIKKQKNKLCSLNAGFRENMFPDSIYLLLFKFELKIVYNLSEAIERMKFKINCNVGLSTA